MKNIIIIFFLISVNFGCFSDIKIQTKSKREIVSDIPLPKVNKPSGTYSSSIFVWGYVSTTKSIYVHYTLDGTEPIKLKSAWLGGGVTISKSCTLKIKAFEASTNICSPTLTLNYTIGSSFTPETFTYQEILYKSRTNIGIGDCINFGIDTLTIIEPKVSIFECEGYFNLKGTYTGIDDYKYMYISVSKDNTIFSEHYFIQDLNFNKKIWLRYGKGKYTIRIYPAPIINYIDYTKDPEYITSPQSAYCTHLFNVTNNREDDGIFKYPSEGVQSDNEVIKAKAIEILTKYNKLTGTNRQKALYLMCYVVDTISYDYGSTIATKYRKPQDAITCITTGLGVCEGYSQLYGALIRSIGIKVKIVRNSNHAWNEVLGEDGIWYLCDLTYNDTETTGIYSQSKFWLSDLTANGDNIKTDERIFK